jgi:hypothetical protein
MYIAWCKGHLLDKAILVNISVRLKAIGGFTLAISCSFNIVARFRVLSVVAIFAFALARLFGFNDGGINNVD